MFDRLNNDLSVYLYPYKLISWMSHILTLLCILLFLRIEFTQAKEILSEQLSNDLNQSIKLEPAQKTESWDQLNLPTIISVDPQAQWYLSLPLEGLLEKWLVKPGDLIEKGDHLADLNLYKLADLKAQKLAQYRVLKARKRWYRSVKKQFASGVLHQSQLDEAEQLLEESKAEYARIQQALKTRARFGIKAQKWKSPISGTVSDISCAPGTVISNEKGCILITDTQQRLIIVHAPLNTLNRLKLGQKAYWQAQGVKGESEPESVYLDSIIPPKTIGGSVGEAWFRTNPNTLLPAVGSIGTLKVQMESSPKMFWVPQSALLEWNGHSRIFVQKQTQIVDCIVELVGGSGSGVVLQSNCAKVGDLVVTKGAFALKSKALLVEED